MNGKLRRVSNDVNDAPRAPLQGSNMRTAVTALALSLSLAACAADDAADISEIADQPLAGTIAGQAWTLVDGEISTFLADDTAYVASLFDVATGGCDAEWPEAGGLLEIEFPRKVGAYELSSDRSVSLAILGNLADGVSAEDGLLVISEITADRVRGGLRAEADDRNRVEGRFDVRLCP
jgi:hypothetical protein